MKGFFLSECMALKVDVLTVIGPENTLFAGARARASFSPESLHAGAEKGLTMKLILDVVVVFK